MADWAALWGDLHYKRRRQRLRDFLCELGWHWPIKWYEFAHPGSNGPWHYEPPEGDWACLQCCKVMYPRRARLWEAGRWCPLWVVLLIDRLCGDRTGDYWLSHRAPWDWT